ncbi:MAG: hypothetical protein ACJAWC_003042 [Yoonia sp.]|jgi:hypothetical protein
MALWAERPFTAMQKLCKMGSFRALAAYAKFAVFWKPFDSSDESGHFPRHARTVATKCYTKISKNDFDQSILYKSRHLAPVIRQ